MSIKNILVTGGRAPATLHLVRLLSKKGYNVFVADSMKFNLSSFSNFVEKSYLISPPRWETTEFISDLKNIMNKHKIDILIPTCEEIFYISQYREELEETGTRVFVEEIDILDRLHNKYSFYKLLKHLDIPTPTTYTADKFELKNKYILKPIYSRFSTNLYFDINDIKEKEHYIAQDFIEGTQYCVYGVAIDGVFKLFSMYKTEMTAGEGATISFKAVKHKEIEDYSRKIIKHLNFNGQIAFDVIVNKDGQPYFIECNPRLTSGIHLYENLNINENILYPNGQNTQLRLAMLLYFFSNARNNGFKKVWKQLWSYKDVIGVKKDRSLNVLQFISYTYIAFCSIKNKKDILSFTTDDIEWNKE